MTTDLATIEAALAAATPGPWAQEEPWEIRSATTQEMVCDIGRSQADAHLIVLLRNAAAELVERVRTAEAEVERLAGPWPGCSHDAVHYLTITTDDEEPRLSLVCTAAPGADCRKRPKDADEREEWYLDDPDIEWVDGPCFAVEWIEEAGWDDAIRCEEGAIFPRWPVEVSYHDEGPWIAPVALHPLLPFPSQCTSDVTLRDEEHRLARCRLAAGHDGDHEDGHGVTGTGGAR